MTRRTISVLIVLAALTLAACGGSGGGGDAGGEDLPTSATVEAGAEPVPQPLAAGRYRLTIQEDCDDYTVSITQEGGEFAYEIDNSPIRIVFVNDVPGGNFLIQQTNPDCTDWSLDLTRVSGP
jgi:predicted small secreted protein